MERPEGYVAAGKKDWVWRLKKSLYGLVQAGRTWYEYSNTDTDSEGFTAAACQKLLSDDFAPAGFWVGDCVAIGSGKELDNLAKSVDANYGSNGPGEVK